ATATEKGVKVLVGAKAVRWGRTETIGELFRDNLARLLIHVADHAPAPEAVDRQEQPAMMPHLLGDDEPIQATYFIVPLCRRQVGLLPCHRPSLKAAQSPA